MQIETPTALVELDEDGVVCARIRPNVLQNPQEAEANLVACERACGGRSRPLLVDLREAAPLDAETRHVYSGRRLVQWFRAIGLLVKATPLGKMMGNVYLRAAHPGVDVRLFCEEEAARTWLEPFAEDSSFGL